MVLFIDKVEKFDIGGFTTDIRKVRYILATQNLTIESILDNTPRTTKKPALMLIIGRFVVYVAISWDLKNVTSAFINYTVDLDRNFNTFADTLSPKAVAQFHLLKEEIKELDKQYLNSIELSDDEQLFEKIYQDSQNF